MRRRERGVLHRNDESSSFFLRDSGNAEKSEQCALQAEFAASGLVPFLERVRAASGAAGTDGDGIDTIGERDVGVGGRAFNTGLVADIFISGAQSGEQRRVGKQFPAGATAQQIDFPFELAFGAVARGFHFVANSGGDAFAESGLELPEFVFAFGANVDFKFRFVGYGVYGSAAFNLADVEGGARGEGNFGVDEADGGAHERVDGVGHAKVGPTVAAGTGDGGFEAA